MTTVQGTILNLDCIAATPSSSYLYGIASANAGSSLPSTYTADSTIVLVRSNYNPTRLSNLTWTVISTTPGEKFSYNSPTFTSVDCAANDKGHFAAFFRSPFRAVSPFRLLPMGARYDPTATEEGGAWSPIWGSVMYGWNKDRFVHRSFYQGDELVHLLTDDIVFDLLLGRVDYATNVLQLGSIQGRIALHNGTFYITNSEDQNVTCLYKGVGRRIEERRGGPYMNSSWMLGDYHVFAGLQQGLTFFGGIYKEYGLDGAPTRYKMYTSEASPQPERSYIEHNLTWTNPASTFSLQESFQSVGGFSPDHEPFIVALTTAGLFEFVPFGPSAGAMAGPFQVTVPSSDAGIYYTSLPQRVVRKMKTERWTDKDALADDRKAARDWTVGGSISAVAIVVFLGFLGWRQLRHRKRRRIRKKKEAEAMDTVAAILRGGKGTGPFSPAQDPTAPPLMSSEKHEVYNSGMALEEVKDVVEEDDSFSNEMSSSCDDGISGHSTTKGSSNRRSGSVSKQPRMAHAGRLPSYMYQEWTKELDLSHHPRPNVVTSVGDQDTK